MEEKQLRILVVDDERPIRRFLNSALGGQYTVLEAGTGEEALAITASKHPDAIILDLGLPDMDGVEVTRRLREWTQTPVVVISVRDREEQKIAALDAGADDYLTKPFGIGELMARLRVVLRRIATPDNEPVYQVGHLIVDFAAHEVTLNEQPVSLTPTEYEILRTLIKHAGKVLTHQQLIHLVWGNNYDADSHLLRVDISNLRRKIEADPSWPRYIMTEPGVGYRLKNIEAAQTLNSSQ
jgi:two-component system, OmpR family, KDP operon response regulator KdpE